MTGPPVVVAEPARLGAHRALSYRFEPASELVLVRGFLSEAERRGVLEESRAYHWERQKIRGVQTLRANAWFADAANAVFEYSGQRWVPQPFTRELARLRDELVAVASERFDSVLAGYYPNGAAAVGYHADAEALFGLNPTLASLSIGASRVFQVAHKTRARPGAADLELTLDDGDLLLMRGSFQHHYRHALKKASPHVGERLNLSFRKLVLGAK